MKDIVAHKGRLRRLRKLVRLARVPLYRKGLRLGVAAATEHERVPLGAAYRTVVDVGAHHGQFALVAARRFPDARIVCIEPQKSSCDRLERLRGLLPQIEILPLAVGEGDAIEQLHVSRKTDASSLLPILTAQTDAFPGTEELGRETVQVRALDDVLPGTSLERPCLLKIDVQGTELSVLRGATRALDDVDCILVECSFVEFYRGQALAGDVISYLNDRFVLAGAFGIVSDGRREALQTDLLFRRRPERR